MCSHASPITRSTTLPRCSRGIGAPSDQARRLTKSARLTGPQRNFPIHKLFEQSCELGLWRLTAHKIAEIFGTRLQRKHRGQLYTIIG